MKVHFGWKQWRRVRQIVQILFFVLFIFLLFAGLQRQTVFPLADFFFRINPLSALDRHAGQPRLDPAPGLGADHRGA